MPRFACRLAVALLSLASLFAPAVSTAQAPARPTLVATPAVGSLVRVTLPPDSTGKSQRVEGTLLASSLDSLHVAWRTGDASTLSIADVPRLEVSLGRHRPVLRSIGMGTVIGAGSLALLTAMSHDDSCPSSGCGWFYVSRGEAATFAGILGAVGGAVVGGIVGAVRTTERWHTVSRGRAPGRIAVTPQLGGSNGVRVRVAF